MPALTNNAINPHFRSNYATLDHVIEVARPALSAQGIAVLEYTYIHEDTGVAQYLNLLHIESGDELRNSMPLICKDPSNPQQLKSAQTYARRMLWITAAGLAPVDEDDDGALAAENGQATQGKKGLPMKTIEAFGEHGELVLNYLVSIGCIKAGQGFEDVVQYRDKIIADPAKVVKAAQEAQS